MQAMALVQGEIKYLPNHTEKYISFSLRNLEFHDEQLRHVGQGQFARRHENNGKNL